MKSPKHILIEINHPAHVHLFRNFISEMERHGHHTVVVIKEVDAIVALMNLYSIPFTVNGKKYDSMFLKYISQLSVIYKTSRLVKKEKIDTGIGISMTLPIVAKFTGITTIGMDDDDTSVTPLFARFVNKSDYILTPDCLAHEHRGNHHMAYPAYHELAYLHPNRFKPDPDVLASAGLKPNEKFFILRFNAFKAHHDTGAQGISLENKRKLVQLLSGYGRILITTERKIDPEFEPFRLLVSPDKIHSLLYYATLFAGDSQTMTSEAAVLGTPALKCNTFAGRLSIPNELEQKYGLCYAFQPEEFDRMLKKAEELLKMPDLKAEWQKRRFRMLDDKIDLTAFLVSLIENYPEMDLRGTGT